MSNRELIVRAFSAMWKEFPPSVLFIMAPIVGLLIGFGWLIYAIACMAFTGQKP